jgi:hypothetical protein
MSISENDCSFAVCKNCIRAFDVDHYWDKNYSYQYKIISSKPNSKNPDADGYTTIFETECPFCFHVNRFNDVLDVHYPDRNGTKLKDAYKAENEVLRRRLLQHGQTITQLENKYNRIKREKAKLADECKRLADVVHAVKTGSKPPSPRQRQQRQKTNPHVSSPYN